MSIELTDEEYRTLAFDAAVKVQQALSRPENYDLRYKRAQEAILRLSEIMGAWGRSYNE